MRAITIKAYSPKEKLPNPETPLLVFLVSEQLAQPSMYTGGGFRKFTVDDTIAWHDPDDVGEWAYDPMFQRDLMASPHFKKP